MIPVLANGTVWPFWDSGAPFLVVFAMGAEALVVASFQAAENRDRCIVLVLVANLVSAAAGFVAFADMPGEPFRHWSRGLQSFSGGYEGYPQAGARILNPVGWYAFDHPLIVLAAISAASILVEYPVIRLLARTTVLRKPLLAITLGNLASHAVLVWWLVKMPV